jgi:hypothetical protein
MISMLGMDEADSYGDAGDNFQPCRIKVEHALERLQALSEFAMPRPDLFGAQQVNAFLDAKRLLTKVSSSGKRQPSLLGIFAQ